MRRVGVRAGGDAGRRRVCRRRLSEIRDEGDHGHRGGQRRAPRSPIASSDCTRRFGWSPPSSTIGAQRCSTSARTSAAAIGARAAVVTHHVGDDRRRAPVVAVVTGEPGVEHRAVSVGERWRSRSRTPPARYPGGTKRFTMAMKYSRSAGRSRARRTSSGGESTGDTRAARKRSPERPAAVGARPRSRPSSTPMGALDAVSAPPVVRRVRQGSESPGPRLTAGSPVRRIGRRRSSRAWLAPPAVVRYRGHERMVHRPRRSR